MNSTSKPGSSGLQRPRVIVTRPAQQAAQWVAWLQQRGVDAVALPLLQIDPPGDVDAVREAWHNLPQRRLVLFVSPNAAEQFFALRPAGAAWPAGVMAASPGPGTSQSLVQLGVPGAAIVESAADAAQFDSESLWQTLRTHDWAGARVLVVRGDGGRDWLADRLRAHGAEVAFVASYRRAAPRWSAPELGVVEAAAAQAAAHVWLFSSSEAIAHLVAARPPPAWSHSIAVATHPRIAEAARAAGFARVHASRPTLDAVAACIQSISP